MTRIEWQWSALRDLSPEQSYAVFAARQAVFVVEQTSIYQDMDGLDFAAAHLIGWAGAEVAAYARVLGPKVRFTEPSIGRVLTTKPFRGAGLGRELVARSLEYIDAHYPQDAVRIGAQAYLERFYGSFGFVTVSAPFIEDGVPHVLMLRSR